MLEDYQKRVNEMEKLLKDLWGKSLIFSVDMFDWQADSFLLSHLGSPCHYIKKQRSSPEPLEWEH